MNIFVYGDESGVFDKNHNDIFVFGGIIFTDRESRDNFNRKYIRAEKDIRGSYGCNELKASRISNKHKAGLFRSTNETTRYAFVVKQRDVNDNIFLHKKSKQRYLDFVYKVGLKRVLSNMMKSGKIRAGEVDNIHIWLDEHSTATNGLYELREGIEEELKNGTINFSCNTFYPPIFPSMKSVCVDYVDSKRVTLVRASDIIANHAFYLASSGEMAKLRSKMHVIEFPEIR